MSGNIKSYEVGSTVKFTFVSSGATATAIWSAIYDKTETLVSSVTGVDSGSGHYYANHPVPSTPGLYVNKWVAQIGVNTYASAQKFRAIRTEV